MNANGGKLLILTYHYVRDAGGPYPGIHPVTPKALSEQIIALKKVLHPATISEVKGFVDGNTKLEKDSFFLTFDDGLADHYKTAHTVLMEHGMRGAFFVPSRPIANCKSPAVNKIHWLRAHTPPELFEKYLEELLPEPWCNFELSDLDKERAALMHIHDEPKAQALKFALNFLIPYDIVDQVMSDMLDKHRIEEKEFCSDVFMSSDEIIALSNAGHEVGLHGHTHAPLSSFTLDNAKNDVMENSRILESVIGNKPRWLSFPYGRPDALPIDVQSFCTECGVDLAFSLVSGFNEFGSHPFSLKRITPNELPTYLNIYNRNI